MARQRPTTDSPSPPSSSSTLQDYHMLCSRGHKNTSQRSENPNHASPHPQPRHLLHAHQNTPQETRGAVALVDLTDHLSSFNEGREGGRAKKKDNITTQSPTSAHRFQPLSSPPLQEHALIIKIFLPSPLGTQNHHTQSF